MAEKYLGTNFDIHGGGLDLVFPHHENEIAQSKAAGDVFANYWMHNAWVTTAGEKMSKSLGNSLLVDEVVKRIRPIELRFYLVGAHYRSMLEYSDDAVKESGAGFRRIEGFLQRSIEILAITPEELGYGIRPAAFDAAMDDDFGVPQALAVLHETVRQGNSAITAHDHEAIRSLAAATRAMLDVLGVDPYAEPWITQSSSGSADSTIDALVQVAIEQRQEARARKDFAAADAIRDNLTQAGITLEDTPQGVRWTRRSDGG
jgi:cysteinyl-tRNA synthetase